MTAETWWLPKNSKAKDWPIWRYMDLAKYLELLRSGSLWLTRCDRFEDPCEGRYNKPTVEAMVADFSHITPDKGQGMRQMSKRCEEDRESTYINCWHCSSYESLAMWRLYAQNYYCIAIQSTFDKLRSALPDWTAITFVQYVDWEKQAFSDCQLSQCLFRSKRLEFVHEREVRAIYMSALHRPKGGPVVAEHPHGLPVEVPLPDLVDSVWLGPKTPEFVRLAVTATTEALGYDWAVTTSSLLDEPSP